MESNNNNTIYIQSTAQENGFLNTFFKIENGFRIDGLSYNSSEHFFQSKKFEFSDPAYFDTVRTSPSSNKAHQLGNARNGGILRPDWDAVKFDVMYQGNFEKFSQNEDLKKMLLDTGDKKISQLSNSDKFWSVTPNGGKDLLGRILMKIRETLKNEINIR